MRVEKVKLNAYMTGVVKKINEHAVGKRIKEIRYEGGGEWPIPIIILEDGSAFATQADDEGNGPGVLMFYGVDVRENLGLYEIQ